MSRKRPNSTYSSRPAPFPFSKRRRPPPAEPTTPTAAPTKLHPPPAVVVLGLPADCSVLDLKSRFEIYGSISRIRIDKDGVGYITFRAKESAESAVKAAADASFGISVDSKRVQVLWATDPLAKWREGVKDNASTSKLVRGEVPLSRHGRGNKLASAVVNTKRSSDEAPIKDVPFKGREIVAYDDIL